MLGDIVFHNKCPAILKDHESYSHFRSEGKSITHILKYASEVKLGAVLKSAHSQSTPSETEIQESFWYVFDAAQKHNARYRMLTSAFYYIGLGLIGVVMLENLWTVIQITI